MLLDARKKLIMEDDRLRPPFKTKSSPDGNVHYLLHNTSSAHIHAYSTYVH